MESLVSDFYMLKIGADDSIVLVMTIALSSKLIYTASGYLLQNESQGTKEQSPHFPYLAMVQTLQLLPGRINKLEDWHALRQLRLCMSCDLIKILVINHTRLWYISINFFTHRGCDFEGIHKFVPKGKMYSLCWEHCSNYKGNTHTLQRIKN